MGLALQLLLGALVPMLAYWAGWDAGWRARGRARGGVIGQQPLILSEGHTQRGNGSGGPATPKPEIIPKPQFPPGRIIGPDGMTIGYRPNPSRLGANPPPREP